MYKNTGHIFITNNIKNKGHIFVIIAAKKVHIFKNSRDK